jgi:hypothetical protein
VLSPARTAFLCRELERRHAPQDIRYEGTAANGESYGRSWRISTYCFAAPETYIHQYCARTTGAPYDADMWRFLRQAGDGDGKVEREVGGECPPGRQCDDDRGQGEGGSSAVVPSPSVHDTLQGLKRAFFEAKGTVPRSIVSRGIGACTPPHPHT